MNNRSLSCKIYFHYYENKCSLLSFSYTA